MHWFSKYCFLCNFWHSSQGMFVYEIKAKFLQNVFTTNAFQSISKRKLGLLICFSTAFWHALDWPFSLSLLRLLLFLKMLSIVNPYYLLRTKNDFVLETILSKDLPRTVFRNVKCILWANKLFDHYFNIERWH